MTQAQKIQLIISICLALGSIGLLMVTLIYTLATRRIAREMKSQSEIMQKEFEIRIAPLIVPKITQWTTNVLNPIFSVTVTNKGFFPVKFDYIYLKCWHREKPDTANSDILQIERWIEKGENLTRRITFHFGNIPNINHSWDVKGNGMASVELHFTDIQKNKITLNKGKVIVF